MLRTFFRKLVGYHKYSLSLSQDEADLVMTLLDEWINGYRPLAYEAEEDELEGLLEDLSMAMEIRERLWQVTK